VESRSQLLERGFIHYYYDTKQKKTSEEVFRNACTWLGLVDVFQEDFVDD